MPFDWADYHALAVVLAARVGDEAAARTAISRAYYAALGRAAAFLRSEGTEISPLRIHGQVSRAFNHSTDPRRVAIGERIALLHQQRNRADYEGTILEDLSAMARDAVARAAFVIHALDDLRANPV